MPNDLNADNVVYLRIADEEALAVLREFLEPLGYRVEFAPDVKPKRAVGESIKHAASGLLFMMLQDLSLGSAISSQLGASL